MNAMLNAVLSLPREARARLVVEIIFEFTLLARSQYDDIHSLAGLKDVNEGIHKLAGYLRILLGNGSISASETLLIDMLLKCLEMVPPGTGRDRLTRMCRGEPM